MTLIGRIGGDEFCLVAPIGTTPEAKVIANRILHKMQEPITLRGMLPIQRSVLALAYFPMMVTIKNYSSKMLITHFINQKVQDEILLNFYSDYLQHKSHRESFYKKTYILPLLNSAFCGIPTRY